jgi:hypothetical protein
VRRQALEEEESKEAKEKKHNSNTERSDAISSGWTDSRAPLIKHKIDGLKFPGIQEKRE